MIHAITKELDDAINDVRFSLCDNIDEFLKLHYEKVYFGDGWTLPIRKPLNNITMQKLAELLLYTYNIKEDELG